MRRLGRAREVGGGAGPSGERRWTVRLDGMAGQPSGGEGCWWRGYREGRKAGSRRGRSWDMDAAASDSTQREKWVS